MRLKCALIPLALALLVPSAAVYGQTGTAIAGPITIPDGFLGTSPPLTELADTFSAGVAVSAFTGRIESSQVPNRLVSPFDGEALQRPRSPVGSPATS